ncbi:MAG: hypothetical protein WD066_20195 [Planctomycetaceae bacterium]
MAETNYLWSSKFDNIVAETDGGGAIQAVYTQEPRVHGELISQRRGSDTSYFHYDGQGNTRALTNASQEVTDDYRYAAWGEER